MSFENLIVLAIVGVAVVAVGFWIARHFFSEEARWERRRRRSNAPIASKRRQPTVKFSVHVKKDDRD